MTKRAMTKSMLSLALCGAIAVGLTVSTPAAQATPGGCLKYGAAGAIAGHAVHHGVKGFIAGCATGMYRRHLYKKQLKEQKTKAPATTTPATTPSTLDAKPM